jgi:hypothetical protein
MVVGVTDKNAVLEQYLTVLPSRLAAPGPISFIFDKLKASNTTGDTK